MDGYMIYNLKPPLLLVYKGTNDYLFNVCSFGYYDTIKSVELYGDKEFMPLDIDSIEDLYDFMTDKSDYSIYYRSDKRTSYFEGFRKIYVPAYTWCRIGIDEISTY